MDFVFLPDEIIRLIWDYLITNRDSISLLKSCKRFYTIGEKCGYIKELSIKKFSGFDFIKNSVLHTNTIVSLILDSVNWVPKIWPKKVIFIKCENNAKISPVNAINTKILCINLRYSDNICIDWEKFPNLEQLYATVHNINLKDIEKCTKLNTINLNIALTGKYIPEFISEFKGDLNLNLVKFTNYYPPENKRAQRWW